MTQTEYRYELLRTANLLSQAIQDAGISQTEVGRRIGLSQAMMNNFCRGRRKIGVETALLLEMALEGHITAESLLISQVHDELYDARHHGPKKLKKWR